ncbi:hypothetical protein ACFR9U_01710 [Halorientalis brevis]|uniref:Uncharacterized protein n=1 Tax=Halorientalis brevis TaxID=1126241 RepID=A0ABD6C8H4_9EURY|nr:hypothetical protein [Halorientalis brevis]
MTTIKETVTGVALLAIGTILAALVLVQGLFAQPPIALPVAILAIGAGIATLDVPEHADRPAPVGTGRRPA